MTEVRYERMHPREIVSARETSLLMALEPVLTDFES